MAVLVSVVEEIPEQCDVPSAVFFDLVDAALLPPLECLEPVSALRFAERFFAEVSEGEAEAQTGVNLVEEDPADTSVGYGGLPNGDGVVQLERLDARDAVGHDE